MFLRKSLLAAAGLILAGGLGAFASAQQTQTQTTPAREGLSEKERVELRERRHERMMHRQEMRGNRDKMREGRRERFSELNLTDEQRKQHQAIIERRLAATKLQREELTRLHEKRIAGTFTAEDEARAQTLKQEVRTAMQGVREEMQSVLTAEQKAQLEQLKAERKQRMELRMKERQERRQSKPTIL